MASVQEPGMVRIYRKTPNGMMTPVIQQRVEQLAPAGGAPDGDTSKVSTPEKLLTVNSPVIFKNDDKIVVTFEPDTAGDGIDASDCIWSIPVVTNTGSMSLGVSQFDCPALADFTTVANEQIVAGYKVTEGALRIAGKIYCDFQDDTA